MVFEVLATLKAVGQLVVFLRKRSLASRRDQMENEKFVTQVQDLQCILQDIDKKIGEEDSNEDQPQSLTNLREFCREAGPKLEEHLHELQEGLAKGKKLNERLKDVRTLIQTMEERADKFLQRITQVHNLTGNGGNSQLSQTSSMFGQPPAGFGRPPPGFGQPPPGFGQPMAGPPPGFGQPPQSLSQLSQFSSQRGMDAAFPPSPSGQQQQQQPQPTPAPPGKEKGSCSIM